VKDNSPEQPDSAGRRAAAYWFSDGLPEIAFGGAYLIFGVLGMTWRVHEPYHWLRLIVEAALPALVILFMWSPNILDPLKARVTYPRTGYVRPPALPRRSGRDENVSGFPWSTVWLFYVAMTFVRALNGHLANGRWTVPAVMSLTAVLLYALNCREARPYSWWAVLPIAVAGWASLWLDMPPASREFLPILIGGVWLLSRGTWTLAHYLRAHPRYPGMEVKSHE